MAPLRRDEVFIDESLISNTSDDRANILLSAELDSLILSDPAEALRRMLSQNSAISTSSSFAERMQLSRLEFSGVWEQIGKGTIGKSYQQPGTINIIKRSEDATVAWHEFLLHKRIYDSFVRLKHQQDINIRIPKPMDFVVAEDSEWWAGNLAKFPETDKVNPQSGFIMERIMPLHERVRKSLVSLFCPPNLDRNIVLENPANKACLARVYLGRRRTNITGGPPKRFFSLRNIPLHRDQLEQIYDDDQIVAFAATMGKVVAIMYWEVEFDAHDIEFVLGSAPVEDQRPAVEELERMGPQSTMQKVMDFKKRMVHLWLLDFNRVSKLDVAKDPVQKMVEAHVGNDPYYPPADDEVLWPVFKDAYLETSNVVAELHQGPSWMVDDLPKAFIDGVESILREKREAASRVDASHPSSSA